MSALHLIPARTSLTDVDGVAGSDVRPAGPAPDARRHTPQRDAEGLGGGVVGDAADEKLHRGLGQLDGDEFAGTTVTGVRVTAALGDQVELRDVVLLEPLRCELLGLFPDRRVVQGAVDVEKDGRAAREVHTAPVEV